ncbi:Pentatricopeptide repeat-containing protein [Apostasia shenzhenica]|uniref:Pentatricopeptide repeat-containing protein n=1 Tax=Apostasia shenzhenica TaxID=1088818 RepID=A0A2H9ZRR5_9ASPA|nr:Pentatricopeptide repeat-containing protein [Apostasia shenzhenica]
MSLCLTHELSALFSPSLLRRPQGTIPRCRFHSANCSFFSSATYLRRGLTSLHLLPRFLPPPMVSSRPVEPLKFQEELEDVESVACSEFGGEEEDEEDIGHFKPEFLPDNQVEKDTRHVSSSEIEVMQLEDLPEQWRRARIAWLCKELPAHKQGTVVRILNAQRKWVRQGEATYIAVHFIRIRENEAAYRNPFLFYFCISVCRCRYGRVYNWMTQQHWFHFNFALATKLADYLGKDQKLAKCREIFDSMMNQGRVPSESTFQILIVAYLSAPVEGCVEEASSIYNQMIQLGGYRPRLSLHNSLFRALLGRPRRVSKHHIKQAEFIYHNLLTCDLEVQKDIYSGLIWLHSYQEDVDRERINTLRDEMQRAGYEEGSDVLISILRACSKQGEIEEADKTWFKLLESETALPSQAFVYRMELHSKTGDPMKSLEIFKEMKEQERLINVAVYHKVIEVMTKANEVDIAETLVDEFMESGMKPLNPTFQDLMNMYLRLRMHDKLEQVFFKCLTKCHPNRGIYSIYLESLVMASNLDKAQEIFNEMHATTGANARTCSVMLNGYLAADEYTKALKIYDIMRQKKYEVEQDCMRQIEQFRHQNWKISKTIVRLKLDEEQREILIGLMLGGGAALIKSNEDGKKHAILFKFTEGSDIHSALRMHVHGRFYEWLTPSSRSVEGENEIPYSFSTIAHSCFGFFADQFIYKGRSMVPKLIHRWLSSRVLAYWYVYGGFRVSSGDIVLKLNGANREDIDRILQKFQANSIACKVKRKAKLFWIAFQGSNAALFWKLIEPFIQQNVKNLLIPNSDAIENWISAFQLGLGAAAVYLAPGLCEILLSHAILVEQKNSKGVISID